MRRNNTRNNSRNQRFIDITETGNNLSTKAISINYSENFNHVTELTVENFQNWKTTILYFLMINNPDEYISTQKVKKLRKKDI